jgi:carotenoid cleavage dioxygenase-like enzyme
MPRAASRWTSTISFRAAEQLSEYVGEFPRTDDRYQMRPYRHGWMLGFDFLRSSLGHIDHQTGKTTVWQAPEDTAVQEPCFIPKSRTAQEGEGYIVTTATRIKEMRTDVFLLDAQHIDRGTLATIRLPLRLRPGYHTSWASREMLTPPQ